MNEQMPDDDKLRDLYRGLPADEPPAHLDEAILAAARKKDGDASRKGRGPAVVRRLRWALPLAAAAGLVLTVHRFLPERAANLPEVAAPASGIDDAAPTASPDEQARAEVDSQVADFAGLRDSPEKVATERSRPIARAKRTTKAEPTGEAKPTAEAQRKPEAVAEDRKSSPPDAVSQQAWSRLKSLGYMDGDEDAAAAIAAKRKGAEAAAPVDGATAPGNGPDGASPEEGEAALMAEPDAERSDKTDVAACEAGDGPPAPIVEQVWPFGLEPGLTREETCRRLTRATGADCEFFAGFLEIRLSPPVAIDRGEDVGALVSGLSMGLRDGRLQSMTLLLREADGSITHRWFVKQKYASPSGAER